MRAVAFLLALLFAFLQCIGAHISTERTYVCIRILVYAEGRAARTRSNFPTNPLNRSWLTSSVSVFVIGARTRIIGYRQVHLENASIHPRANFCESISESWYNLWVQLSNKYSSYEGIKCIKHSTFIICFMHVSYDKIIYEILGRRVEWRRFCSISWIEESCSVFL